MGTYYPDIALKGPTARKRNPTEATNRNVKAANKKIAKLTDDVKTLKAANKALKSCVEDIEKRLDENGIY